jgi:hypothetical protein
MKREIKDVDVHTEYKCDITGKVISKEDVYLEQATPWDLHGNNIVISKEAVKLLASVFSDVISSAEHREMMIRLALGWRKGFGMKDVNTMGFLNGLRSLVHKRAQESEYHI